MNEDQCYLMSYSGGLNQPGHFVGNLGRELLGRHRAVRHLRLLAPCSNT